MRQSATIRCLRSEIDEQMKKYGYSLTKLSKLAGIRLGYLSETLNRRPPRPITINLLDSITKALHQPPGWLYELYPGECISDEKVSRPRMIPFLIRCAKLGRLDLITSTASKLLEIPKNIEILFYVAEQLWEKGLQSESIHFYRLVIENERDSFHDRFTISQYRLFRASLGTNAEDNKEALVRFELYYNRLAEDFQLDALLHMANIYYTLENWKKVERYADELRELAGKVYEDQLRKRYSTKPIESLNTDRHLVVYYGQGFLLKGIALTMQEQYEEAKNYVSVYSDLGWFEFLDEIGKKEVEKFRIWGKGNMLMLNLMTGNQNILPDYSDFLEDNPTDTLPYMLGMMEAANRNNFSVDDVVNRFCERIPHPDTMTTHIKRKQLFRFWYEKAIYNFKHGRRSCGIKDLLTALNLAEKMQYSSGLRKMILLMLYEVDGANEQQEIQKMLDELRSEHKLDPPFSTPI
ncbi:helix-turn-helix domain-containing protein [Paenibacillus ehimensis]|uniref:helix-turn-helix domain-containing protein n=1 Tax=Paenibacillus ehimensis TaxID=79264 RepID=UPI000470D64F|nr:helix-turn-helix transcriptional regulator [Paenibacillus ehimensis]